jgi:hypothetical protein
MRAGRTISVLAIVAAIAIGVPLVVMAGGGVSPLNRQEAAAASPAQKSNKTWSNIPGLSNIAICADNALMTFDVSLTASGGAFRARVSVNGNPLPAAQFDPTRGNRSFSYSFGTNVADGSHDVDVQWRSVTGDTVRLQGGNLVAFYQACV